jgi:hypothetical protein
MIHELPSLPCPLLEYVGGPPSFHELLEVQPVRGSKDVLQSGLHANGNSARPAHKELVKPVISNRVSGLWR